MELAIKTKAQFVKAIADAGKKTSAMKTAWHNLFMYAITQAVLHENYKEVGEFVKTMTNGSGRELMIAHIRKFTDVQIVRGDDKKTITGSKKNKNWKVNAVFLGMSKEQMLVWYDINPYYSTMQEQEVEEAPIDFIKAFTTFNKRIAKALADGKLNNLDEQTRSAYEQFVKVVDAKTNSLGKVAEVRTAKGNNVSGAKSGIVQRRAKDVKKQPVAQLQAA